MRSIEFQSKQSLNISGRRFAWRIEAGAYKAIKEELSRYSIAKGIPNEPLFHIVSGTSIGAANAAILVSYVKENKTWEGSDERLVEFWEYLSTESCFEKYLTSHTIGIPGTD
jgi:predicted acylesterase/phospholipase RssA